MAELLAHEHRSPFHLRDLAQVTASGESSFPWAFRFRGCLSPRSRSRLQDHVRLPYLVSRHPGHFLPSAYNLQLYIQVANWASSTDRAQSGCQTYDKKAESVIGRGVVNRPCRQAPVNPQTPRTEKGTEGRPACDMCEHLYPIDPPTSAPSKPQIPLGSGLLTHRTRVAQLRRHGFRFRALPRPQSPFPFFLGRVRLRGGD